MTETRSELTRLNAALKLLDKYAPVKSKLLSSRPEVTEREFLDVGVYRKELDAVAQLEELEADVRRYNGEEAKLRSSVEALRPWETLDLPLSMGSTATNAHHAGHAAGGGRPRRGAKGAGGGCTRVADV